MDRTGPAASLTWVTDRGTAETVARNLEDEYLGEAWLWSVDVEASPEGDHHVCVRVTHPAPSLPGTKDGVRVRTEVRSTIAAL